MPQPFALGGLAVGYVLAGTQAAGGTGAGTFYLHPSGSQSATHGAEAAARHRVSTAMKITRVEVRLEVNGLLATQTKTFEVRVNGAVAYTGTIDDTTAAPDLIINSTVETALALGDSVSIRLTGTGATAQFSWVIEVSPP